MDEKKKEQRVKREGIEISFTIFDRKTQNYLFKLDKAILKDLEKVAKELEEVLQKFR